MTADKILYATDFSPGSEIARELASFLASSSGATLYIAHVDDVTPDLVPGDIGYGYIPAIDEIAREQYDKLQSIVPTIPGVKFQHRFMRGEPVESLLQLAEKEHADMIVIGTHGKTGMKRILMGSVAEDVVRRARCPVLTVRQSAEGFQIGKPSESATSQI